jgi:phage/plasmid-associated DNA primase
MAFSPAMFSRNPITVTAVLLSADNVDQVASWCGGEVVLGESESIPTGIDIWSTDGEMFAGVGDWVIQDGPFFFPCKPTLFQHQYSPYHSQG